MPIGFSVSAAGRDQQTGTLTWSIPDPEVGVATGGGNPNDYCNAPWLTAHLTSNEITQTVQLSRLASAQPQTYSFDGGPVHWSNTPLGDPESLNYQWQITLTVQRAEANGNTLPPGT